jgi:hypothetical protein
MVTDGRVVLRASAYVELHLWLAASAKNDSDIEHELEPAKRAYARSLANDDDDALLERTTRALAGCADDRCAFAAVAPTGFASAYERALPEFVRTHWLERAKTAWVAIERSHNVLEEAAEALFARAAADLSVSWPEHVSIDVVSEAPPASRAALFAKALATQSMCFAGSVKTESDRLRDARVLDCLLVRSLLDPQVKSPIRESLVRQLGEERGGRAWELVVVHVAAGIVRGWEPKHASVDRRSAESVDGRRLEWLAKNWHGLQDLEAWVAHWSSRESSGADSTEK